MQAWQGVARIGKDGTKHSKGWVAWGRSGGSVASKLEAGGRPARLCRLAARQSRRRAEQQACRQGQVGWSSWQASRGSHLTSRPRNAQPWL